MASSGNQLSLNDISVREALSDLDWSQEVAHVSPEVENWTTVAGTIDAPESDGRWWSKLPRTVALSDLQLSTPAAVGA